MKKGAQQLLAQAILLGKYENETINCLKRVVQNGYQPERNIQTELGDIEVKVPKVRDRKNESIKFNSSLVPPLFKTHQKY